MPRIGLTPPLCFGYELNRHALFNAIRRTMIGYDVQLHKRTLERGLISLIGPEAVITVGAGDLMSAPEHAHLACELGGKPVRVIRTDVGVDVFCDSEDTAA